MKRILILLTLCPLLFAGPKDNLVDVAVSAGSFNTLVNAVVEAGLAETLASEGPFTIFAPTDEAFAKLPEGTLDQLLEDKEALKSILLYHVVPGTLEAKDVLSQSNLTSVEGSLIDVTSDHGAKVNQSNIVKTDIMAKNGVIHVIDQVILPPKKTSNSTSCSAKKGTTT